MGGRGREAGINIDFVALSRKTKATAEYINEAARFDTRTRTQGGLDCIIFNYWKEPRTLCSARSFLSASRIHGYRVLVLRMQILGVRARSRGVHACFVRFLVVGMRASCYPFGRCDIKQLECSIDFRGKSAGVTAASILGEHARTCRFGKFASSIIFTWRNNNTQRCLWIYVFEE